MRPGEDGLVYGGAGSLAAILLGAALVPFRDLTPASNLALAFLILTLVVAELGGSGACLATAVSSALSLDFFLTRPYGRLSIADKNDVIAFVGLAVCGLVVASLGSTRRDRNTRLAAAARHRDLLRGLLDGWDPAVPPGYRGEQALRACADAFPVSALVLRDAHGSALWASGPSAGLRPLPEVRLDLRSLSPAEGREAGEAAPLPGAGARIPLATTDGRALGWLDVWGDGGPAGTESRRALSDVARLLAVLLAGGGPEKR